MGRKPATRSAAGGGKQNDDGATECHKETMTAVERDTQAAKSTIAEVVAVLHVPESETLQKEHVKVHKGTEAGTIEEVEESAHMEFASEDAFRRAQKVNSVATIAALRLKPLSISRLRIPLCRLAVMPMVRPAL